MALTLKREQKITRIWNTTTTTTNNSLQHQAAWGQHSYARSSSNLIYVLSSLFTLQSDFLSQLYVLSQ